jgi:hypothetical protein
MYSFWNPGSQTWSAPAVAAAGLVGAMAHASAARPGAAFAIVARDADPQTPDGGTLDLYTWNGAAWSTATTFASGGVDNRTPEGVYDASGGGHVVWVRNDELVEATLADPTPRLIRGASGSMAFFDIQLVTNPQGNLTLLWQEVADNEPANIFAAIYDTAAHQWSEDRRLTEDPVCRHENLRASYGADGRLRAAFVATEIERHTLPATLEGQPVTGDPPAVGRLLAHVARRADVDAVPDDDQRPPGQG